MATISITDRYRPAYLSDGVECIIMYWVRDPLTAAWVRKREKLNHIRDAQARRRFAHQRVRELNTKLAIGWNPIVDQQAPRASTPIGEALDVFLATKKREGIDEDSERSYRSLLGILRQWLDGQGMLSMAVGLLSEERAIQFMDHCYQTRGISKRTHNNYKAFFGTLALWWRRHKYVRENIFAAVERKRYDTRKKNRRPLTDEERPRVRTFLAEHHPRFLAFSLLVYHCALRPKEAFQLKPEHIDLEHQVLHVLDTMAKTNKERHPAIPNVLVEDLRALRIDEQDPTHYIFSEGFEPGAARKRSTYSGKWWLKVRAALGLPMECKHYSLRDTAVLQLARDNVSRVDSMNHYDHHSSEMHDVYSRQAQSAGNNEVRQKMSRF